jgi:hypothetical protein
VIAALVVDPVVQRALTGAAALLFVSVSLHKLRDTARFRAVLADYHVLPGWAVPAAARAIPAAEGAVAALCLVPGGAAIGCVAGAGLLAGYSAAIGFNLARGRRRIDCGCGGLAGDQSLSAGLLARNAALVGLLLLAALPESQRPLVWLDAFSTGGLLAALALLHAALDVALANATRLRPEPGTA